MKLISENIFPLLYILFFTIILSIYLLYQHKQLKKSEVNNLNYLFLAFKEEKLISSRLKNVPKELKKIEQNTQQKFQKIKVDILNLDFSYKEILFKL